MVVACKCYPQLVLEFVKDIFYDNMNLVPILSNDIQFMYRYLEMKRIV